MMVPQHQLAYLPPCATLLGQCACFGSGTCVQALQMISDYFYNCSILSIRIYTHFQTHVCVFLCAVRDLMCTIILVCGCKHVREHARTHTRPHARIRRRTFVFAMVGIPVCVCICAYTCQCAHPSISQFLSLNLLTDSL